MANRVLVLASLMALSLLPLRVCADESDDSRRHGRLCLAAMEVDNFSDADFWCTRAAQDFAGMASSLPPGAPHDTLRIATAFYLGRVALANRTLDHAKSVRFIDKTTAAFAELIKSGATDDIRKTAGKNYLSWVKEMRS